MARRKKREDDPAPVDERDWKDWWGLREEIGKRLGGRGATGESDPEVLAAARLDAKKRMKR